MDLLALDEMLFRWINIDGHNVFMDYLLPFVRNKYFWGPLYIFALSFILINFPKRGLLFLLSFAICISLADTISSRVLKKNVKRLRPCKQEEFKSEVKLLVHCGSGYSFPSSHAANHFAAAFFFIFTLGKSYRKIILPLLVWAGLISFAQVYVGVHFPVDVICGGLLGFFLGKFVAWLYIRFSLDRGLKIVG